MCILQAHPWLSEKEKQELCNIIDYRKLSIDACAHASQNDRLPLRAALQVLFFEQLQLRAALGGYSNVFDGQTGPGGATIVDDTGGQMVRRDTWVTVVRENQVLRVDLEKMRSKVGELEDEFSRIKQEMHRVAKSHSSLTSPRLLARGLGCKLLPRKSDAQSDIIESVGPSPRVSLDQARFSHHSRHRKSLGLS